MSDTLYWISEEINIFMRNWEQSQAYDEEKWDGTISFNAQWEFEALYEKLNKKLNSFVGYIRSIEDQIIAIDRKQAELQAMKIKKQKKIDSMMSLLKFIMEKQNITEIDTGREFY
jgi:DNA topoisomerase VI subunit A